MAGQSEELLEALVDLERAKEKERESRFESEVLLDGLRAITAAPGADEMLASLLRVLRNAIGFDEAFILAANGGDTFQVVATTDPVFRSGAWVPGAMFKRVLAGSPVALFDVTRSPEWEVQPIAVKTRVRSALHAPLHTPSSAAIFVCISGHPGFFNKQHVHLLQRFSPLASQAIINLGVRERELTEEALRYTAFQAGVAETATSILHNIGNAITGICNRARRLQQDAGGLLEAAALLDKIRLEMAHADANQLIHLADLLAEASRALRAAVTEDIQASADVIGEGVKHIAEIITIQQGAVNPERVVTSFCLRRLLEDGVTMQADSLEKYGIRVDIEIDPPLAQVSLPRNQLLQTVVNLIKNSREAIQARAHSAEDKRVTLAARAAGANRFRLHVIDNGCGMESEQLANLFRRGYSGKQGGHGYGLHWVANFVQGIGGTIAAHSAGNDKGAEIRIELPIGIG